jgi:hypothetical protein
MTIETWGIEGPLDFKSLLKAAVMILVIGFVIVQGPALYKEWTEPVHERAFRIAVGSNQVKDACAEARIAARGYLESGDKDKYDEWTGQAGLWCGIAGSKG